MLKKKKISGALILSILHRCMLYASNIPIMSRIALWHDVVPVKYQRYQYLMASGIFRQKNSDLAMCKCCRWGRSTELGKNPSWRLGKVWNFIWWMNPINLKTILQIIFCFCLRNKALQVHSRSWTVYNSESSVWNMVPNLGSLVKYWRYRNIPAAIKYWCHWYLTGPTLC